MPLCPVCLKSAWPAQAWMHKGCVVVNSVVVNKNEPSVVVNRTKDRHKDKAKRAAYMRDYMRKRRAAV